MKEPMETWKKRNVNNKESLKKPQRNPKETPKQLK